MPPEATSLQLWGEHSIPAGVCPTRADTFQRETALLSDTQERKGRNRNNPCTVKRHLAFETKFQLHWKTKQNYQSGTCYQGVLKS